MYTGPVLTALGLLVCSYQPVASAAWNWHGASSGQEFPPPPSLIYPQIVANCSQFTWRGCLERLSDELAAIKNLNVAQCHRPTEKIKKRCCLAQHDGTAAGGALLLFKLNWKLWVSAKIQLLGDTLCCQQANSLTTYKYFQYFHSCYP